MIGQVEACARATDVQAAVAGFADALKPYGLVGLEAGSHRLPEGPLTSEAHFEARRAGTGAAVWPKNWAGTPGHRYVCLEQNPLLDAVKRRAGFYLFSDLAPRKRFGTYWEAFSEGNISEGIGMRAFGTNRRVSALSIVFERLEMSPGEMAALRTAGAVLIECVAMRAGPQDVTPNFTPREHDCIAYVAAGKSDWEISVILGVSQATVRFHVDNARRKLNATTRAHAVARMAAFGLL